MKLTLSEVAEFCGGELSAESEPGLLVNQVVIDSRKALDNTLFVALNGNNYDGHAFVQDACSKYKLACLVNKDQLLKSGNSDEVMQLPNLIFVEDTTRALGNLAAAYRKKFNIPVVGITGSNGKTTVKEMLKEVCENQFGKDKVLATDGNLNNHLGMPLTLLKLTPEHKVAIIEMGMNHKHELEYLTNLASPTLTVVNNVMLAHAGFFNSIEDIARAKAEIYHGLSKGGIACINVLEPLHPIFAENVPSGIERFYYGSKQTGCYITSSNSDGKLNISTVYGELELKLQVLGEHNQRNALTVVALALNLGCTLLNIKKGLNDFKGFPRRLERKTAFNGALIIDDSYNANPDSAKAAILAIKQLPSPHWLVLADLRELGEFGIPAHREIGEFAAENGIDYLLTIGELAAFANSTFQGDKLHFTANDDIVKYCLNNLPANATLLIKGSLSTNLKEVVSKLLKECN